MAIRHIDLPPAVIGYGGTIAPGPFRKLMIGPKVSSGMASLKTLVPEESMPLSEFLYFYVQKFNLLYPESKKLAKYITPSKESIFTSSIKKIWTKYRASKHKNNIITTDEEEGQEQKLENILSKVEKCINLSSPYLTSLCAFFAAIFLLVYAIIYSSNNDLYDEKPKVDHAGFYFASLASFITSVMLLYTAIKNHSSIWLQKKSNENELYSNKSTYQATIRKITHPYIKTWAFFALLEICDDTLPKTKDDINRTIENIATVLSKFNLNDGGDSLLLDINYFNGMDRQEYKNYLLNILLADDYFDTIRSNIFNKLQIHISNKTKVFMDCFSEMLSMDTEAYKQHSEFIKIAIFKIIARISSKPRRHKETGYFPGNMGIREENISDHNLQTALDAYRREPKINASVSDIKKFNLEKLVTDLYNKMIEPGSELSSYMLQYQAMPMYDEDHPISSRYTAIRHQHSGRAPSDIEASSSSSPVIFGNPTAPISQSHIKDHSHYEIHHTSFGSDYSQPLTHRVLVSS